MAFNFDDERLDPGLRSKIAVELDYKTLINLCNTLSKNVFESICGNNWFWEQKTKYDFRDLYDIEELEENWRDTYQCYRKRFTEDLLKAIKIDKIRKAKRLLRINKEKGFLIVDETDEDGRTPLIWASKKGHTDIVEMLLNAGVDPNLANKNGRTALMKTSKTSIAKILLKAGADPNLLNKKGETALMHAYNNGYPEDIIYKLVKAGTDPNIQYNIGNKYFGGWTFLMWIIYDYNYNAALDIAELILTDPRTDLNIVNEDGKTALIMAYNANNKEMFKLLLKTKTVNGEFLWDLIEEDFWDRRW